MAAELVAGTPAVTLETPDEPTRHQSLRPTTSPNAFKYKMATTRESGGRSPALPFPTLL